VAEHFEFSSNSHKWKVNLIIAAYDRKMDLFTSLFNLLYSFKLRSGGAGGGGDGCLDV
jgi:hypothetical protein